jgi:uncharacterized protein involved in type VI secretion and phage assembly
MDFGFNRPTWDDTFGHYNDQWADPAKGPMTGRVVEGSQKSDPHRVDVYLPLMNITLHNVRVSVPWSAGAGTGIHALPHDGAEVKVEMKHGKHGGVGQAEVTGVMYSEGDYPAPSHPSLKDQKNFYAVQGRLGSGYDYTPGSIQMLDDQGGHSQLIVGKETHHAQGATDTRHKGLSQTEPEMHGMFAANSLAQAADMAAKLDPTNMGGLAQGFAAISKQIGQAEKATTSTALTHARQVMAQADTVAIGQGAGALAAGSLPEGM